LPKIIYVILFKVQIDILLFIGFLGFHINRMLCVLFSKKRKVRKVQYINT
jgi:CO dehydrogenase/acetyl-CoA synthase epsilon subunit